MDWITGSKNNEVRNLISQLADPSKRERAAQELIKLDVASLPALLDALQTQDRGLLPLYQHILGHIPSATPALIKALETAHPLIRARVVEALGMRKDRAALPTLRDALKGEYFTVR